MLKAELWDYCIEEKLQVLSWEETDNHVNASVSPLPLPLSYGKIFLIFYLYVTAIGQCNKSQRELWKWGGLWLSSVVISRICMLMLISTRGETGVVWNVFVSGLVIGIWLIRGRLATLDHSKEPDPNTAIKWIAGCDLWQSCSVCPALLSLALCTNRST